jgi:hypothetical protein
MKPGGVQLYAPVEARRQRGWWVVQQEGVEWIVVVARAVDRLVSRRLVVVGADQLNGNAVGERRRGRGLRERG